MTGQHCHLFSIYKFKTRYTIIFFSKETMTIIYAGTVHVAGAKKYGEGSYIGLPL